MSKGILLSEEAAQDQIDLLVECYEIEVDDGDRGELLGLALSAIRKDIRRGRIEVQPDAAGMVKIVQTLGVKSRGRERIEYGPVPGLARTLLRRDKNGDLPLETMHKFLAAVSKEDSAVFDHLVHKDHTAAMNLMPIFLL